MNPAVSFLFIFRLTNVRHRTRNHLAALDGKDGDRLEAVRVPLCKVVNLGDLIHIVVLRGRLLGKVLAALAEILLVLWVLVHRVALSLSKLGHDDLASRKGDHALETLAREVDAGDLDLGAVRGPQLGEGEVCDLAVAQPLANVDSQVRERVRVLEP